jgi:hypothetical protein
MQPLLPLAGESDYPRSVITLTQIEAFLALVEEGGVTRAAETDFLDEVRLAFAKPAADPPVIAPSRDFYGPARQFT